jgi:hypothetical protein
VALTVATLIDRAKALADRRNDASIPDTDWVTYVNWAVEDLYRFLVSIDPGTYFQTIDFTLTGGPNGSTFNLDLTFTVRLATVAALPACTASGAGPGKRLDGNSVGVLSVDGTVVVLNDLVLVKNQVNTVDDGIYVVTNPGSGGIPFTLTRASTFDQANMNEVQVGAIVTPTVGTLANDPCILTAFGGTVDGAGSAGAQTWIVNDVYTRFRSLHGLDVSPDTTSRRTVGRRNFRERNQGAIGPWYPAPWAPDRRYDLRATILTITPYETAAGLYRAYYRGGPYKWAGPTDNDPLDAQLEVYDEYLAVVAARRGLAIEASDVELSMLDARVQELRASISSEHQRDDEPAVLGDVEVDIGTAWWP